MHVPSSTTMPSNLAERFSTRDGRFYPIEIDGEIFEYPSVTTVLDMVRVKGFLDKWEAELIEFIGVDGHKKYLEKKANEGTAMHNLIEYFLKCRQHTSHSIDRFDIENLKIPWNDDRIMTTRDVNNYTWEKFVRWTEWWEEEMIPLKPEVIWTEKKLYSQIHQIAGRADVCFLLPDGLWIYDWKSGKSNEKHKIQISTYVTMEEGLIGKPLRGGRVVSLGEETKKGWKVIEVSTSERHKNSSKGESEVDFYFRGFSKLKEVVQWHCPHFGPNNKSLPRFIVPQ